jgi:hypothetical protein
VKLQPLTDEHLVTQQALSPHGSGDAVDSYVGTEFPAYVRVLNPPFIRSTISAQPVRPTWADIAQERGLSLTSETQWVDLENDDDQLVFEPDMGTVERTTAEALASVLSLHTATPEECVFANWVGYASQNVPKDAMRCLVPPGREMYLMTGDVRLLARSSEERLPMRWWPRDGAWAVGNDIYARSVFVGGSVAAIEAVMRSRALETIVVDQNTRVTPEDL